MKILYLQNIRLPTEKAHGLQIMETCAAFAAAGHEVTLAVSSWKSADEQAIFSYYGLAPTFSIRTVSGGGLLAWKRWGFVLGSLLFGLHARRELDLGSYDAVYTRDEILVRPSFYYEMHDVHKGLFQRRALARAAGVIVITRGLADHCRSTGVDGRKILVAPDGVDLRAFDIPESREACRAKLGLPPDKKVALYAGHLYSWKGADILARAASLLGPEELVVFVGGMDHDIAPFKSRFGSDPKISIVGRKPHALIPLYLRAADILILPNSAKEAISRLYTSPIKLFEYMASGTPIVASDLPSLREILDESNAVLCAPDDPHALAEAISKLLHDERLSERISIQARADVKGHTWDARSRAIADFMGRGPKTKDRDFYDKESGYYSLKRYPPVVRDYIQSFFKRRLAVTLKMLAGAFSGKASLRLLEIGCADGIVMREISGRLAGMFSGMTGIDTAEGMIRAALSSNKDPRARFFVRGKEPADERFDAIVEIGVANYADFDAELAYIREHLKENSGFAILSIAGSGSRSRPGAREGYRNFLSYAEYEKKIEDIFTVVAAMPVGLRLLLIWRMPALARIIQPAVESLFRKAMPDAFHEKVYLLRRR